MKNLIIALITLLCLGCSPEKMVNKKLQGDWSLVTINNEKLPEGYSKSIHFTPKGKGGDLQTVETSNNVTITKSGIYSIIKYDPITFAFPNDSLGSGYETEVYNITKSTTSELILTQMGNSNKIYSYIKK